MGHSLSTSQLAARCQAEASRFQETGQSNESYCWQLFRRALADQDRAAWQAVHAQYRPLVAAWVRGHSHFADSGETVDFFVNATFTRLWQSGRRPDTVARLETLGQCLQYLKLCAGAAIVDYVRWQRKDALAAALPLAGFDRAAPAVEQQAEQNARLSRLKEILGETLYTERERLVAEESWIFGLAPRQIQAHYAERFSTVAEVSRIKRNIIKRLKRKLT